MMRKTILKTLAVLILSILSLLVVACSPNSSEEEKPASGPHVCNYQVFRVVESTCKQEGYTEYKCTCGRFKKDNYTERKPHVLVEAEARDNICQVGWYAYEYCENCDYSTRQSIPAQHKWKAVKAQEADCYNKGWNNHSVCEDCGETKNKVEFDYNHGKMIDVPEKKATCLEAGYTAHKQCSDCHQAIGKTEIEPLGHYMLIKDDSRPATCEDYGYNPYEYCTRCDYTTLESNKIKPLGHSLVNHERKKATCTESGYEAYQTCSRKGCGYTTFKTIPATGHDFEASLLGTKKCSKCNAEEETFMVVNSGLTDYKIYYNASSTTVNNAAAYLNDAMKETVGVTFGTARTPAAFVDSLKVICIGHNTFSELAGLKFESEKTNAFQITTKGKSIFILGSDLSLKFGVYELMNIFNGYERYSVVGPSIGEEVYYEEKSTIELAGTELEKTVVPDIDWNIAANAGNVMNTDYGFKEYTNAQIGLSHWALMPTSVTLAEYPGMGGIHNILNWIPINQFYFTKPQWYAKDVNGTTLAEPNQPCFYALWNDQTALNHFFSLIKKTKASEEIYLSPMDNGGHCKCPECNGNLGYQYLMFFKKITEMAANDAETAHIKFVGTPYQELLLHPPVDEAGNARVVLGDNAIMFCALNYADVYAGLSNNDIANLESWSKCCKNLRFWIYNNKFDYHWMFFDDFSNKQKTYENLVRFNTSQMYDEGNSWGAVQSNFSVLRTYLCGKLGWNSGYNMSDAEAELYYETLTSNFFNNYFGPASVAMRKLFEKQKERNQYMHDNWTTGDNIFWTSFEGMPLNAQPINELGNPRIGTGNSYAYHLYIGSGNHGNRNTLQMVYSKQDFITMLGYVDDAIKAINSDNSLSAERKQYLINRVELEKSGVMFQMMWIYSDAFCSGNNTFTSSLNAEDLAALGVKSEEEAAQMFVNYCVKFEIPHCNYITLDKMISNWKTYNGWNIVKN